MKTTNITTKTKWKIDLLHSQVGFKVKHLKFSNVRGTFKEFDASIYTIGEDFMTAQIDFWLNPASIDTGNEKRDDHLRSTDFFDVEKFKVINFCAIRFENMREGGRYEMYGDLTMKGVKNLIRLDVELGGIIKDPFGNDKALFNLEGLINRKGWGLNWNTALEAGGVLVSEEVWISCELQLIKQ
jgi:polyisoprenoid-binding protein YceI